MNNTPLIQLCDLTTGYTAKGRHIPIAEHLNATLQRGTLTCLLGPNGAGKSTLLKTLSAFLPPLDGKVLVQGRPIGSYSPQELSRLVGMVLTERVDVPGMTVREMVAMGRSPYTGFWGTLSEADSRIVEEAMQTTGIKAFENRQVNTLSDGERQKVMLAKALAQQTPLILLDEPTAFLDFPSKVEAMLLLKQLAQQEGRAIFLSTHDLDLALQTADQLWLLHKGKPLCIGTPRELADNGLLPEFFQSSHIRFDSQALRFSIATHA